MRRPEYGWEKDGDFHPGRITGMMTDKLDSRILVCIDERTIIHWLTDAWDPITAGRSKRSLMAMTDNANSGRLILVTKYLRQIYEISLW